MGNKIERVVSNAVWEITESVENINDVQDSNIKTLLNRYGSIVDALDKQPVERFGKLQWDILYAQGQRNVQNYRSWLASRNETNYLQL